LDCLDKEVFLVLTELRADVETSDPPDPREVQEKWEREDNRALLVPRDLQERLVVLVIQDHLELLERQEQQE